MRQRALERLFVRLGARIYDRDLSEPELESLVVEGLADFLDGPEEDADVSPADRARLVRELRDDMVGHGPIEQFLADPSISEVMVNGTDAIYIEQAGRLHLTGARFVSEAHLRQVIERIVARTNRRIDESSPMVDARLPDGSRVNAIVPPLAVDGPTLTIRKFGQHVLGIDELVATGSVSPHAAALLDVCVKGRLNLLVTGGTGTGKTTLLNILSSFIPDDERIVTIEDAIELRLRQFHVVRLESRPPNVEGRGAVTIRDLLRNALRMRPDRLVIGEVRGGEALDMLQAMNTGHDGSLSTLHANSPRDSIARIETMSLMAGMEIPLRAVREQVASAVDLIVHISRLRDGSRRITSITELVGMEGDMITLSEIFRFDHSAGFGHDGRVRGTLRATGLRPVFADKLSDRGYDLDPALFSIDEPAGATAPAGAAS
ncbi:MAG: CpaF family protein [Actinomycetota bacterium]|nr:CpaF family protein [Actinomycetota bacterium]